MITKLQNIYDDEIVSSVFFDKNSVEKCMEKSYDLGRNEVLNWLSEMNHISDNINYLIEEYKNQNFSK